MGEARLHGGMRSKFIAPLVNQGGKASKVVAMSVVAKRSHPWRMIERNNSFVSEQMFFSKKWVLGFQSVSVVSSCARITDMLGKSYLHHFVSGSSNGWLKYSVPSEIQRTS
jgi:hypothetical protein